MSDIIPEETPSITRHTEEEIIEYFAEWRANIEKAERDLARNKMDYAACLREYKALKNLFPTKEN